MYARDRAVRSPSNLAVHAVVADRPSVRYRCPTVPGVPVALAASTSVYDSAEVRRPLVNELRNFWGYRGLIRLLVRRDITVRYKRSVLGVAWTFINPLVTTAVMWFIFSEIFQRSERDSTPFIVYLLSGLTIVNFFSQGIVAAGSSLVNSRGILTKVFVPPEIFAMSASLSGAVNFAIMLIPLLAIQVFTGVGIPWTVVLIVIPALAMLITVVGIGLLLAAAAVHFYDVLDLTKVLAQLMTWLVPTFYPLSMIPDRFIPYIKANPLYSYLRVFRSFVYEGQFAEWWNFVVMGTTTVVAFGLGTWIFARSWKSIVARL